MTRSQRRDRALEIIRDVGLPDPARMVESYPHQLSGRQRQRIMIAMAMVLTAPLIADEPTTALRCDYTDADSRAYPQNAARAGTGVCSSPRLRRSSPR